MDSLTFGAPRFLRHLMDPSSKKIPVMEFEVSKVLEELNPTMDQFIDLCILSGCDYRDSIRGLGGFVACRALSPRNDDLKIASMPWDKDRDGFVMGECARILVMESLDYTMKRYAPIITEYLGGGVNCDAYHMTDPRANGLGVSSCIQSTLEDASVSTEEVILFV